MIKTILSYLIIITFISCIDKNTSTKENISSNKIEIIKMHKLEKLFITGDFNGDKKLDTLFQHNFSELNKKEIDRAPDPYQNDWEDVVDWFFKQESYVYLSTNKNNADKLYLTTAQGLYCLINIGDNNSDGKDEIALVTDLCDFSRINSCSIYTICENKWTKLKQFGIHEGSFDYKEGQRPIKYLEIKDYLEKHNGKWLYKDNDQIDYDTPEEVGKMKELKIDKCN